MKKLGKRGISPLIATIILVAICVAGGLMVYSTFFSASSTLMTKGQLEVESIDLVKDTEGNVVFSITIKNTGNKPVKAEANALLVTLASEGAWDATPKEGENYLSLQPGQTVSLVQTGLTGSSYTIGNSYNVVIEATFSDDSTFAHTTSVKCRSA